jgi:tetratricopeptide (TPR) repeat protein
MTKKNFVFLLGFVLGSASPSAFAQTPVATAIQPQDSEALYQQALDTYLNGDYDQAILLAAKSVEVDPKNQKAENLLMLLTNEKKDIGNYEIWLSTHPSSKLTAEPEALPESEPLSSGSSATHDEIGEVQKRLNVFYAAQTRENGQFQGQIQAVSELLRENSNHQYDELRKSQVDLMNEMETASRGSERNLWILYLLCFGSMFLSACALWSIGRKPGRN